MIKWDDAIQALYFGRPSCQCCDNRDLCMRRCTGVGPSDDRHDPRWFGTGRHLRAHSVGTTALTGRWIVDFFYFVMARVMVVITTIFPITPMQFLNSRFIDGLCRL